MALVGKSACYISMRSRVQKPQHLCQKHTPVCKGGNVCQWREAFQACTFPGERTHMARGLGPTGDSPRQPALTWKAAATRVAQREAHSQEPGEAQSTVGLARKEMRLLSALWKPGSELGSRFSEGILEVSSFGCKINELGCTLPRPQLRGHKEAGTDFEEPPGPLKDNRKYRQVIAAAIFSLNHSSPWSN